MTGEKRRDCDPRAVGEQASPQPSREAVLALYRHAPFGIGELDRSFKFRHVNEHLVRIDGVSAAAHLGRSLDDVLPGVARRIESDLQRVLASGESLLDMTVDAEIPAAPGVVRRFTVHAIPVMDEAGSVSGITCIVEEITERREIDRALLLARSFLDNAADAAIGYDRGGRIVYANSTSCDLLGYSADDILALSVTDIDPQASLDDFARARQRVATTGPYVFETAYVAKTGKRVPVEVSLRSFEFEQESLLICMSRDITERMRFEADRGRALAEAEQANSAKSEFLATMSHELRTPLNAIRGFSEMLIGEYFGSLGSQKYKEYVEDIHTSSEHLLHLINDVLDLAVIESGEKTLEREAVNVTDVIDSCSQMIAATAEHKGLVYDIDVADPDRQVLADRRALKQILLNVLSNAVKFTPPGGRVTLRTYTADDNRVFQVADTGEGVPADQLPLLTDPFVQVHADPHHAQEGTGLGLSIVRSLVDLHGGTLNLMSEVGQGTTVIISIPSAR